MELKDELSIIILFIIIFILPLIPAYVVWTGLIIDQWARFSISFVVYVVFLSILALIYKEGNWEGRDYV